jgi:hypothetical protein
MAFVTLDAGGTDTKTLSNLGDRGSLLTKGIHNPLAKIHGVGLHEAHYPASQC